ncbi:MAG: efflux transporter outer membrane subunit [Methylococcales bacterium]|nr:efflux transporter outer membrane subunit [Methylococcales bacterium]
MKIALCIFLFLNGCAWLPEDSKRAELLELTLQTQTLSAGSHTEKIIRSWVKPQWWRDFHNSELNRLIETALKDNPSLHAATARLTQSEAVADFQEAEMLPSISSNIEFHHRRFSEKDFYGPTGGQTLTGAYIDPVVFRYHLDLWGKDKAKLEAAIGKEQAQASELAVSQLLLSTAITRSYIELCAVEEDVELLEKLTEKAHEKLQLVTLRWKQGLSSQDPVHENEQKLETLNQQKTSVQTQAQLLRNRLATLAGKQTDWGKTIHTTETNATTYLPPPESLSIGLLAHRPDVVAALWRVESAAKLIHVAKTAFYPDVNLVGFAGLRSLNLKDLFLSNGASVAYGIGPTITLPLFEGGRLDAELKNQQAAYDVAVETYNHTLLTAAQQVADNVAQWRQTVEHDAAQERAIEAAKAELELAQKRYQAGLSTRDGFIDSELNLLQQQLTDSKLHAAHLLAAVSLIETLGGGYENHTLPSTKP